MNEMDRSYSLFMEHYSCLEFPSRVRSGNKDLPHPRVYRLNPNL